MEKILRATISGLESGLRVIHIAEFGLKTCSAAQPVSEVLDNPKFANFDQIPVRQKSRIVGVLERRSQRPLNGLVEDHMVRLDGSLLVTAEEPLTRFVPLLRKNSYRLVLLGTDIRGIVTRSDVIKPPVRLLAFTLVSHLEMAMADLLREQWPTDAEFLDALGTLSTKRRRKIEGMQASRLKKNLVMPAVELSGFEDKCADNAREQTRPAIRAGIDGSDRVAERCGPRARLCAN